MFERFTEKARRVIFFARYEASQYGAPYIQPEHLFLGLLREDRRVFADLLPQPIVFDNVAHELRVQQFGEKISTSVDLPLSEESKQLMAYMAEEADSSGQQLIGTVHLVLAFLKQPGPVCELLKQKGLTLEGVRQVAKASPAPSQLANEQIMNALRSAFRAALENRLKPELEPAVTYSAREEKPA